MVTHIVVWRSVGNLLAERKRTNPAGEEKFEGIFGQ
jgi:hypothetical protein